MGLGELATACIACYEISLFKRVSMSIWIAMPKRERGGAFLQEQELDVIAVKFKIV